MLLPNFEFAVISDEKLRDYSLNPNHPFGKHKAKVFEKRLGIVQKDWEHLKTLILDNIAVCECIESITLEFGRSFIVDIILFNFEKQAKVRTSWIIKNGELMPRLTSCYVIN